ncbi:hypothetical protein BJ138DRAFT_534543 [Hygrophoropsis aurantiaca]|uniref:Uncharacterized protein n=1 Tax=Hygrophoropsis aurantiaca TaxID=72124 RepID=A0ACB8A159_9AGAM|nr:hypothetical protein BJ138DRAFT_534543 [Hygrophoropsis aurantiaca]
MEHNSSNPDDVAQAETSEPWSWHPPQFLIPVSSSLRSESSLHHPESVPAPALIPPLLSTANLQPDADFASNFPRAAKWCADGSSVLAHCENRSFQLFDTGAPESDSASQSIVTNAVTLQHARTFQLPAPVLDFAWYPGASSRNLPAYCFVASVRECPVKLLDATDGRLRASYKIVDHRERYIAPHSMAFNSTADKLYCGFEDAIEIFDIHRPGEGDRLHTTPSKKSRDGLKGIVSALAFPPYFASQDLFAAGTLTPYTPTFDNIALFNEASGDVVGFIGGIEDASGGGVVQLKFNPVKPHILYASFRRGRDRDDAVYAWDLRGDGAAPVSKFVVTKRSNNPESQSNSNGPNEKATFPTNQKIQFDIDVSGRWMGMGNQVGNVLLFDLDESGNGNDDAGMKMGLEREGQLDHGTEWREELHSGVDQDEHDGGIREVRPAMTYKAHQDTIGSVGFHPLRPFLISASGSRDFDGGNEDSSSSSSDSEDEGANEGGKEANRVKLIMKKSRHKLQPSVRDASIKLWSFDGREAG